MEILKFSLKERIANNIIFNPHDFNQEVAHFLACIEDEILLDSANRIMRKLFSLQISAPSCSQRYEVFSSES